MDEIISHWYGYNEIPILRFGSKQNNKKYNCIYRLLYETFIYLKRENPNSFIEWKVNLPIFIIEILLSSSSTKLEYTVIWIDNVSYNE